MHNRIVKKHFISGDHALFFLLLPSPSALSLSLSAPNAVCQGLSVHSSGMARVCVRACVRQRQLASARALCLSSPQRASIHRPGACFPGDAQLRVRGGWQRDGRPAVEGEGGHVELEMDKGCRGSRGVGVSREVEGGE